MSGISAEHCERRRTRCDEWTVRRYLLSPTSFSQRLSLFSAEIHFNRHRSRRLRTAVRSSLLKRLSLARATVLLGDFTPFWNSLQCSALHLQPFRQREGRPINRWLLMAWQQSCLFRKTLSCSGDESLLTHLASPEKRKALFIPRTPTHTGHTQRTGPDGDRADVAWNEGNTHGQRIWTRMYACTRRGARNEDGAG